MAKKKQEPRYNWKGTTIPIKPLPAHLIGTVLRKPDGVIWRNEGGEFTFSPIEKKK